MIQITKKWWMSVVYANMKDMSQENYDVIESEPMKHTDFLKKISKLPISIWEGKFKMKSQYNKILQASDRQKPDSSKWW